MTSNPHVTPGCDVTVDPKHKENCKKAIAILEESYIVGNDVAIYDKRTGVMVTIANDAIPIFRLMLSEQRAGERG